MTTVPAAAAAAAPPAAPSAGAPPASSAKRTPARRQSPLRRLMRDKAAMVAAIFLIAVILAAILAPWIAPTDPYANNLRLRMKPPSAEFWLGTDAQGRDMVTRILFGMRTSFFIGFVAVAIGGFIGATLGILAAYYSRLDNLIMRIVDVLLTFPAILLGLAIAAVLGPGVNSLIVALAASAVPTVARITRGAASVVMRSEYMEAGRAVGLGDGALIWRYLAPNCVSTILVYLTLQFGQTVLLGASLSFLGLGVQPPVAELGSMAAEGRNFLFFAPHVSTVPSVAIFLVVLAFNVLGDAMRDVLDPRLRQ